MDGWRIRRFYRSFYRRFYRRFYCRGLTWDSRPPWRRSPGPPPEGAARSERTPGRSGLHAAHAVFFRASSAICRTISNGRTGLPQWASKPASRAARRSSSRLNAVSAMAGIRRRPSAASRSLASRIRAYAAIAWPTHVVLVVISRKGTGIHCAANCKPRIDAWPRPVAPGKRAISRECTSASGQEVF